MKEDEMRWEDEGGSSAQRPLVVGKPETVTVITKSAWLSKINWTQAVAVAASVLVLATGGKIDIPLEQQAQIVVGIGAIQGLITWVFKTWFTPTITPASAAESGVKTLTID